MNKFCVCVLFACLATCCASYSAPSGGKGGYIATGGGYGGSGIGFPSSYGAEIVPTYGAGQGSAYGAPSATLYSSSHPQAKSNAYAANSPAPTGVFRQVVVPSYTILEIPEVISQHGSYVSSPAGSYTGTAGYQAGSGSYNAPAPTYSTGSGVYHIPAGSHSYQAPAVPNAYPNQAYYPPAATY